MTWNYRVVTRPDPTGKLQLFGIHEVYYDSAGRIEAWTEEPCTPFGESLEELIADMDFMAQAMGKPVLKEAELIQDSAQGGTAPGPHKRRRRSHESAGRIAQRGASRGA